MAATLTAPAAAPTTTTTTASEGDGACEAFVPFPLLADRSTYNPWTFDYNVQSSRCVRECWGTVRAEQQRPEQKAIVRPPQHTTIHKHSDSSQPVALKEWLEVFRKSIPSFRTHALQDPAVPASERAVRFCFFVLRAAAGTDGASRQPNPHRPTRQQHQQNNTGAHRTVRGVLCGRARRELLQRRQPELRRVPARRLRDALARVRARTHTDTHTLRATAAAAEAAAAIRSAAAAAHLLQGRRGAPPRLRHLRRVLTATATSPPPPQATTS